MPNLLLRTLKIIECLVNEQNTQLCSDKWYILFLLLFCCVNLMKITQNGCYKIYSYADFSKRYLTDLIIVKEIGQNFRMEVIFEPKSGSFQKFQCSVIRPWKCPPRDILKKNTEYKLQFIYFFHIIHKVFLFLIWQCSLFFLFFLSFAAEECTCRWKFWSRLHKCQNNIDSCWLLYTGLHERQRVWWIHFRQSILCATAIKRNWSLENKQTNKNLISIIIVVMFVLYFFL